MCRSLASIRLELNSSRCATSAKLRVAYESRAEQNAKLVEVLNNHQHMWKYTCGPSPEKLFRPSLADIERCREACERLDEGRAEHGDRDGYNESADDIVQHIGTLKSLEWDDIRKVRLLPAGVTRNCFLLQSCL